MAKIYCIVRDRFNKIINLDHVNQIFFNMIIIVLNLYFKMERFLQFTFLH